MRLLMFDRSVEGLTVDRSDFGDFFVHKQTTKSRESVQYKRVVIASPVIEAEKFVVVKNILF